MLILIPTSLIALVMLVLALLMAWYASTWETQRGWLLSGACTGLTLVIAGWLVWQVVVPRG